MLARHKSLLHLVSPTHLFFTALSAPFCLQVNPVAFFLGGNDGAQPGHFLLLDAKGIDQEIVGGAIEGADLHAAPAVFFAPLLVLKPYQQGAHGAVSQWVEVWALWECTQQAGHLRVPGCRANHPGMTQKVEHPKQRDVPLTNRDAAP